jgi:Ca2+-transporting ATPase
MITGDHRDTAVAIGQGIGLHRGVDRNCGEANSGVLTGSQLDGLDAAQLARMVDHVHTYARVTPEHKVKIVAALQQRGHVVAMTGDGVNDAPALVRADIGIAMGRAGTDVSREAADVVLVDDNYATIVASVEEGRVIFANIRKVVAYLLSCNIGEILIILLAMLAGLPLPLRPIQLLWLNLITDGAPAVALGAEPGSTDVMREPPRPPSESIVTPRLAAEIGVQAAVTGLAVFAAFALSLRAQPNDLVGAQTAALATLVVSELLRAFTARSETHLAVRLPLAGNPWLLLGAGSSALLLTAVLYVPALRPVFGTVPLAAGEWARLLPFMLAAPLAAELLKLARRRRGQ